ncbi:MAG: M20 family metallopeptidase [Chloroflexota bacterium]|nr:M20 family metallopeptidase [Dehalococcoidia bacterium]MDW8047384.1 M20 family metallopeptidase [Chloroflexota bacterium]
MTSVPSLPALPRDVASVVPYAVALRREFHQYPELSWHEVRTQARIIEELQRLGLDDVRPIAKTGATALVRGRRKEPCLLWRADIDALPIPERSELPFASRHEGVMHACGHDAHAAIALGIARVLAARARELPGSVRFVFQPAEEASGGAEACIAEGVLDEPRVSRVLGLHISADIPIGMVNVAPGPFFAAPTSLRITIEGKGGHAASPHQGIDAVLVAAHVIVALQAVVSRMTSPHEAVVLTIGKVEAGYRGNVLADRALLSGTIRTYSERVLDRTLANVRQIVAGVCAAFGATAAVDHRTTCPPLVNDPAAAEAVRREALAFFGEGRVLASPSMGADDMAVFLQQRPGCYFWLGARNEAQGIAGRHHDPAFVIDEGAIGLGIAFGVRVIERALRDLARG